MQTPSPDPIPFLWQKREQLKPLLARYGARSLGKAIAQLSGLDHSRTSCHQLAALMIALTDFQEWFDYADFYISLGEQDAAVALCVEELRVLRLLSIGDAD
jgi:hypothetical protein